MPTKRPDPNDIATAMAILEIRIEELLSSAAPTDSDKRSRAERAKRVLDWLRDGAL